jgi:hydroxymethylglutaryl-CoA lyase
MSKPKFWAHLERCGETLTLAASGIVCNRRLGEAAKVWVMLEIVEVAPRDGLQNSQASLTTVEKIELVDRALAAGIRRVEVASFVNPSRVPSMADAEAVLDGLRNRTNLSRIGLVLNSRGLERAIAARVDEVNFVVVASDSFNRRNQGVSIEATMAIWRQVSASARAAGLSTTITIGAAFGCPFEGEVPVSRVAALAAAAAECCPDEIALADTIGVGSPSDVVTRFAAVRAVVPTVKLRAHFHNTRNTGLANAAAAVTAGVESLDASLGGIGGCPFAPAATGNIPTEDLAYMLQRMGLLTDLDLSRLIVDVAWLQERLEHPVPGLLSRAGLFPSLPS